MLTGGGAIYNITGTRDDMQFIDVAPGIASFCRESDGFNVAALNIKPHETEEMYPDWYVPIHLDPASEIQYWKRDSFHCQVMRQGMFNLCPQGVTEKVRARVEQKIILVTFDQRFIEKTTQYNVNSNRLQHNAHYGLVDNSILYLAMALRADFEAGSPYGRLYGQSLALAFMGRIFDIATASDGMKAEQGSLSTSRLNRVTEYIKAHLNKNLSLNEIADVACLTPFHFSRQFKNATHLSPHQFVLKLKIEHAEKLLTTTDLPIADIALELGFQSQSHFTTVFHKMVGVTPKKFKR
ncbi:helix-turn-helix transcriptional regulator [Geobacter sp. FeAm09]|uniref:helix-turn-helix domain-containing protein n=1 Tax=Geobacter sp. FeAm09 TaxID=2597769 RepID=UPI0011EDA97F|nr:AraC family transcriptional regulator [Geobacter sp. FeAm09]QEM68545.1 helix-turn-helix transcriptional regulator [Geobacter sp. FeAm09]